jgi:hypothetical protein
MTTKKKELTLTEKMADVIAKLHVPKGQYNSFGKYNYRSCEDILESIKPLLAMHQLVLTIADEVVQISDRVYVKAVANVTDGEKAIKSQAFAREPVAKKGMDESQITGTASSYARKYALNGLFCIDDTKDSDHESNHQNYTKAESSAPQNLGDYERTVGKAKGKKLKDHKKEDLEAFVVWAEEKKVTGQAKNDLDAIKKYLEQ